MEAEVGAALSLLPDDAEEQHVALWPPGALQALLSALMHDQAVKVRSCMR